MNRSGFSNYPADWVDYYRSNLRAHCPAIAASYRTHSGFRFDEMPSLIRMSRKKREVLTEARRRVGMSDGFCVPVRVRGKFPGKCMFTVAGGVPLPFNALPLAQLIGHFAYEAVRRVVWTSPDPKPSPAGALTSRQLDCVLLIGRGKTDREIAQLLGTSEDAVVADTNEARRHYGVERREQLPLQALYRRDLSFTDMLHESRPGQLLAGLNSG